VKDPREALEAARRAAAGTEDEAGRAGAEPGRARVEPGAAGAQPGAVARDDWALADPSAATRRLVEWAIIEPDQARVYSTRAYGRPITWLKRGLIRLLRQYLDQVTAQQSRFNANVAAQLLRLEERVSELERRSGPGGPAAP